MQQLRLALSRWQVSFEPDYRSVSGRVGNMKVSHEGILVYAESGPWKLLRKRRVLQTGLTILAAFIMVACEDFDVVDKSKQVVISKEEYEQLKAAAAQAKQVGRYQLHREGSRTWRLDTATGHSCLLLATEYDWKSEGSKENSCVSEDWKEGQERHRLYPSLFDQNGDPIPKR